MPSIRSTLYARILCSVQPSFTLSAHRNTHLQWVLIWVFINSPKVSPNCNSGCFDIHWTSCMATRLAVPKEIVKPQTAEHAPLHWNLTFRFWEKDPLLCVTRAHPGFSLSHIHIFKKYVLTSLNASYFGQEFLWHLRKKPPKTSQLWLFRFFLSNVPLSGEQTVTCFVSPVKICGSSRTRFVLLPPTTLLADFVHKHFPSPAKGLGNMRRQIIWCSNLVKNPIFSQVWGCI